MTQPMITKTIRVPHALHEQALARLKGESFTAYVNRLIAEDVKKQAYENVKHKKHAPAASDYDDEANTEMGLPSGIPWGNK